jgi:hypothetical protein
MNAGYVIAGKFKTAILYKAIPASTSRIVAFKVAVEAAAASIGITDCANAMRIMTVMSLFKVKLWQIQQTLH